MSHQKIIFTNEVAQAIDYMISEADPAGIWIIADTTTAEKAVPYLRDCSTALASASLITLDQGDSNKTIETVTGVWASLSTGGATRRSLVINVGGGMVTDLGGFAAATFKRGVRFFNVPTTLLGAVDAAVGGKTGINFSGLKNEIGVFREADAVIISTRFLSTLPHNEILSGYAEMIKHGIIADADIYRRLLEFDITGCDQESLLPLLEESVEIKRTIVRQDPHEHGLRRALNFGHTAGHAFESLAIARQAPVPHGYAVAWGMVVETVLSHLELGFPSDRLHQLAKYILDHYSIPDINCNDYPELIRLMGHDKKNPYPGRINFTLLNDIADVHTDCIVTDSNIRAALDIFRDLMQF